MTLKTRRLLLTFSVLAFLLTAPALLFYTAGYRLAPGFKITKTGGLYVFSPEYGAEIFINNKPKKRTNFLQAGLFLGDLTPDTYSILVAKDGFWPWYKEVEVKEKLVAEARALLVPQNPETKILLRGNFSSLWSSPSDNIIMLSEKNSAGYRLSFYLPETESFLSLDSALSKNLLVLSGKPEKVVWQNKEVFIKTAKKTIRVELKTDSGQITASLAASSSLPATEEKTEYKKLGNHKKEAIWLETQTNKVFARWLGKEEALPYYFEKETMLLLEARFPVRNLDFFPKRTDAVIMATANGVFALEMDNRGSGRLIQPIYKGKEPNFAVSKTGDRIYVLDEKILFSVEL